MARITWMLLCLFILTKPVTAASRSGFSCPHQADSEKWKLASFSELEQCLFLDGEFKAGSIIEAARRFIVRGKLAEARSYLEKTLAENPFNKQISLAYIDFLIRMADFDAAKNEIARVSKLYPRERDFILAESRLNVRTNNAGKISTTWLEKNANSISLSAVYGLIDSIIEQKKLGAAEKIIEKISLPDRASEQAIYYFLQARLSWMKKNFSHAEKFFNKAITLDVGNSKIVSSYVDYLHERNKNIEASAVLERAIAANPQSTSLNTYFVKDLIANRKFEQADRMLLRLAEEEEYAEFSQYHRARLLLLWKGPEALASYLETIQSKGSPWATKGLAKLYYLAEQKEKAIALVQSLPHADGEERGDAAIAELLSKESPYVAAFLRTPEAGIAKIIKEPALPSAPIITAEAIPDHIVVKRGHTISQLAEKYLGSSRRWKELAELNGLDSAADLRVGMRLRLKDNGAARNLASETAPGEKIVTVRDGETLAKVSFRIFGTHKKWKKIFDWNREKIENPDDVPVGTKLIIKEDR